MKIIGFIFSKTINIFSGKRYFFIIKHFYIQIIKFFEMAVPKRKIFKKYKKIRLSVKSRSDLKFLKKTTNNQIIDSRKVFFF